ncbi:MAG TPA: hypothetical protein VMS56_13125 [Thermoanaerobaculia bacterium]|nr:hypothetical protein [Thermoanaerobaculia bacterium]
MRSRLPSSLALIVLVALPLAAQEMPQFEWSAIYEEDVKPSMLAEYEAGTKKMIKDFNDKKLVSPYLYWDAYARDDSSYIFVIPLADPGDLGKMNAAWMGAMGSMGEAWMKEMMSNATKITNSYASILVARRPDLSYMPENPRLTPAEAKYVHHDYYYLIPGKEMEAEQLARDWAAALKKANFRSGFTVFQAMMGDDLPAWAVSTTAKDAVDWASINQSIPAALGADQAKALNDRLRNLIRKHERGVLTHRPDLSRPMPE